MGQRRSSDQQKQVRSMQGSGWQRRGGEGVALGESGAQRRTTAQQAVLAQEGNMWAHGSCSKHWEDSHVEIRLVPKAPEEAWLARQAARPFSTEKILPRMSFSPIHSGRTVWTHHMALLSCHSSLTQCRQLPLGQPHALPRGLASVWPGLMFCQSAIPFNIPLLKRALPPVPGFPSLILPSQGTSRLSASGLPLNTGTPNIIFIYLVLLSSYCFP